jgi:hypothetical protein
MASPLPLSLANDASALPLCFRRGDAIQSVPGFEPPTGGDAC